MKNYLAIFIIIVNFSFCGELTSIKTITVNEFIKLAETNTTMQKYIAQDLSTVYQERISKKDLALLLSVDSEYTIALDDNSDGPTFSLGLSTELPRLATSLSVDLNQVQSASDDTSYQTFSVSIAQPLIQNAFGILDRLSDKKAHISAEITRNQIIELKEDYIALLYQSYLNWLLAHRELIQAQRSLADSESLLKLTLNKKDSGIADKADVLNMRMTRATKAEAVLSATYTLENSISGVSTILPRFSFKEYVPVMPTKRNKKVSREKMLTDFFTKSRTIETLQYATNKLKMTLEMARRQLLPSASVTGEFNTGSSSGFTEDKDAKLGFTFSWPLFSRKAKATVKLAKNELKVEEITQKTTALNLRQELDNLSAQITLAKKLYDSAKQKEVWVNELYKITRTEYTQGRSTLQELLDRYDTLDSLRFSVQKQMIQLESLKIEWLRVTDHLLIK